MSQENLEAVRRVHQAWARGNFRPALDLYDPGITLTVYQPEGHAVYEGLEAAMRFLRDFFSQWVEYRIETSEFIDAGEHVYAAGRQTGIGKTSGVDIDAPCYCVWTFRDSSAVALLITTDDAFARATAGLED
jgi:ketosteroid isomerase-like protein